MKDETCTTTYPLAKVNGMENASRIIFLLNMENARQEFLKTKGKITQDETIS